MATVYCSSTGTNTSPYDTWAKAATAFKTATDYASTNDVIWIDSNQNEDPTITVIYTLALGVSVYSVDISNDQFLIGAHIDNTTSTYDITAQSVGGSFNGIIFSSGDDMFLSGAGGNTTFNDCTFNVESTTPLVTFGSTDCYAEFNNCAINALTASTTAVPLMSVFEGQIIFNSTTIVTTSVNQELMALTTGRTTGMQFHSCDLSGVASTTVLIDSQADGVKDVLFHTCKMPTSITALSNTPVRNEMLRIELRGCTKIDYSGATDDHDTYWYYEKQDWNKGRVSFDTTTYLVATYDEANGFSVLMEGSADLNPSHGLRTKICEIPAVDLTTSATFTVNFTCASTLTDTEFYLLAERNDATDLVLGVFNTSRNSDILGAGTWHTTNTESWITGKTNDYEDSITITGMAGVDNGTVSIYAVLVKPSVDVYIDPLVVIT